jgi:hypothetical protein
MYLSPVAACLTLRGGCGDHVTYFGAVFDTVISWRIRAEAIEAQCLQNFYCSLRRNQQDRQCTYV